MKMGFFRQNLKKTQMSNFIKICSVGVELLHADGQADRQDEDLSVLPARLKASVAGMRRRVGW
jgi:hypothetical protein